MTREDIIRMALEAGMSHFSYFVTTAHVEDLERFAALVAAAERDASAAAEREACAKVCEAADKSTHPADLADAIRARG